MIISGTFGGKDGPDGLLSIRRAVPILFGMRNPELLPAFCLAFAVELAHLRWILLNQWRCRGCRETQLQCECKPAWVKLLL